MKIASAGLPVLLMAMMIASGPAMAAVPGSMIRSETLKSQANALASVAGNVDRGAAVTILARQGGWVQIQSGKLRGWVRLLSVRAGSGGAAGAGLGDVVGVATTKSDSSRVVAVAGVRGLSEEDLKKATFNPAELAKMESQGVTKAQAIAFARGSGLSVTRVVDLPKPEGQTNKDSGGTN
jgi:Bacterial SH3 domain